MEISVRELKNHLSKYLRRVQAGEEVIVTSHKRVVAKLIPPNAEESAIDQDEDALIERLKSMPWVRWAGGKPQLRSGVTIKQGQTTVAQSLLDDRQ